MRLFLQFLHEPHKISFSHSPDQLGFYICTYLKLSFSLICLLLVVLFLGNNFSRHHRKLYSPNKNYQRTTYIRRTSQISHYSFLKRVYTLSKKKRESTQILLISAYVVCTVRMCQYIYDDACGRQIGKKKSKSISIGKLTNFV